MNEQLAFYILSPIPIYSFIMISFALPKIVYRYITDSSQPFTVMWIRYNGDVHDMTVLLFLSGVLSPFMIELFIMINLPLIYKSDGWFALLYLFIIVPIIAIRQARKIVRKRKGV